MENTTQDPQQYYKLLDIARDEVEAFKFNPKHRPAAEGALKNLLDHIMMVPDYCELPAEFVGHIALENCRRLPDEFVELVKVTFFNPGYQERFEYYVMKVIASIGVSSSDINVQWPRFCVDYRETPTVYIYKEQSPL